VPLVADIPTDRRTEIETSNRDLALSFPAGFSSAGSSLAVRVEPGSGGFRVDDGVTALRAFRVTAITAGGDGVNALQAPVTICAGFSWASAQGVAQERLAPYWVDPTTGTLRTEGLRRLLLQPATQTQDGRLCFETAHFTEFVLATAPPSYRLHVPMLPRARGFGG
jgi:hypothetical protein